MENGRPILTGETLSTEACYSLEHLQRKPQWFDPKTTTPLKEALPYPEWNIVNHKYGTVDEFPQPEELLATRNQN